MIRELKFRVSFIKVFTILLSISESVLLITSNANNVQVIQISSGNDSSHFPQNAIKKSVKPPGKIGKVAEAGEISSASHPVIDGFSANHEEGNRLHIFKVKPKHSIKRFVNEWNKKTHLFDSLPYRHQFQFANNYQRRGFDSFYPPFYLSSRFNGYRLNDYQPYFHSNYENRNSAKRFINRRQDIDGFPPGSYVHRPDTKFDSYFPNEKAVTQNIITFLPINLRIFHKAFGEASNIEKISTIKLPTADNPSRNYSELVKHSQNSTLIKPLNFSAHSSKLSLLPQRPIQRVSSNKRHISNPDGNFPIRSDILSSVVNPMLKLEQKNLAPFDPYENENRMFLSDEEAKFERAILKNKTEENDFDLFANSRVYYDKVPQNLNDSWFLYVNCSRENCQFTNSTNETELIKEGWVLHNCTKQGCTEMYPKTEAIRKFIGLMLLVFSLCILKIVAFVLLFYYCRKIKLTKQGAENKNSTFSDDEKKDPSKNQSKDIDKEITVVKQADGSELTFSEQKNNSNISVQEIKPLSSLLRGVGTDEFKVWTPPVQRVSSCLTEPDRDNLVPTKDSEKIVLNFKNSEKLLKKKSTNRSYIPKLEKLVKYTAGKGDGLKEKQIKNSLKDSEGTKPNTADGELLLMNLDDDPCYTNACHTERASKWEDMLKECDSFISIDIHDDEPCKK